MSKFMITVLSLILASPVALAQQDDADASTPGPNKCPDLQASTVFIPDQAGNRQTGSAEKLSKTHKTAESQGWNFDEMQIYVEDGDLQGFFVTYTRTHPCNR